MVKRGELSMTREEARELLPIIQAFSEGRIIEFSSITDVSKAWREVTDFPIGMIKNFKFRIKPEPKYRPFANAEECWTEMQKHQPFGWVKDRNGSKFVIENVDSRGFVEVYDEGTCNFKEVFENRTFADRLPFGVKVEE